MTEVALAAEQLLRALAEFALGILIQPCSVMSPVMSKLVPANVLSAQPAERVILSWVEPDPWVNVSNAFSIRFALNAVPLPRVIRLPLTVSS